jgi:hypothetical protein
MVFYCLNCPKDFPVLALLTKHKKDYKGGTCASKYGKRAVPVPRHVVITAGQLDTAPAQQEDDDGGGDGGSDGGSDGGDADPLTQEDHVKDANDDLWATCQNLGLTGGGVVQVLALVESLLGRQEEHGARPSIRTVQQYEALTTEKLEAFVDGWMTSTISLDPGDVPGLPGGVWPRDGHVLQFEMEHRDMGQVLEQQFGDVRYEGHFVCEAAVAVKVSAHAYTRAHTHTHTPSPPPTAQASQRLLNHPHECETWLYHQQRVREAGARYGHPDGILAGLQFYSDKTLVNRKRECACTAMRAAMRPPPCSRRHAAI